MRGNYGARYRLTFRGWLYQHRQDNTAIGNIARAVMVDRCLPGEGNLCHIETYQRHWQQVHTASVDDLRTLRAAWEQYQGEIHANG